VKIPVSNYQIESRHYCWLQPVFEHINIDLDGDSFCATFDWFYNLAEDVAGFGYTEEEAISELIENYVLETGNYKGFVK